MKKRLYLYLETHRYVGQANAILAVKLNDYADVGDKSIKECPIRKNLQFEIFYSNRSTKPPDRAIPVSSAPSSHMYLGR